MKGGPPPGIGARLKAAAAVGGGDALARITGIPRRTLGNYFSETSEPKISALVRIAEACDVEIGWLATGQGSKHFEPELSLDELLLERVVAEVDAAILEKEILLSPEKKAAIIAEVYLEYAGTNKERWSIVHYTVVRLINITQK